jgi:hypothetical protein
MLVGCLFPPLASYLLSYVIANSIDCVEDGNRFSSHNIILSAREGYTHAVDGARGVSGFCFFSCLLLIRWARTLTTRQEVRSIPRNEWAKISRDARPSPASLVEERLVRPTTWLGHAA